MHFSIVYCYALRQVDARLGEGRGSRAEARGRGQGTRAEAWRRTITLAPPALSRPRLDHRLSLRYAPVVHTQDARSIARVVRRRRCASNHRCWHRPCHRVGPAAGRGTVCVAGRGTRASTVTRAPVPCTPVQCSYTPWAEAVRAPCTGSLTLPCSQMAHGRGRL